MTVRETQSFMYFSCSTKGIDLEDASGQKPYGCVTRNSAQTQTSLSFLVNFTPVRSSPAVPSLSEKTKDSCCLYTAPLIRKNILKLNSCHLQASPPVTHSDLRGAHEKEEAILGITPGGIWIYPPPGCNTSLDHHHQTTPGFLEEFSFPWGLCHSPMNSPQGLASCRHGNRRAPLKLPIKASARAP